MRARGGRAQLPVSDAPDAPSPPRVANVQPRLVGRERDAARVGEARGAERVAVGEAGVGRARDGLDVPVGPHAPHALAEALRDVDGAVARDRDAERPVEARRARRVAVVARRAAGARERRHLRERRGPQLHPRPPANVPRTSSPRRPCRPRARGGSRRRRRAATARRPAAGAATARRPRPRARRGSPSSRRARTRPAARRASRRTRGPGSARRRRARP